MDLQQILNGVTIINEEHRQHGRQYRSEGELRKLADEDRRWVYALTDPRHGLIFYVGQSKDPWKRHNNHCVSQGQGPRFEWIENLRLDGYSPGLVLLEQTHVSEINACEEFWIGFGLEQGWPLTNGQRPDRILQYVEPSPRECRKLIKVTWPNA